MAIIYSYPLDLNPTTTDLLLGSSISSGKPTKTFSIASLVALVNAQPATGTVTNVSTANSTFINVQGGPITGAGTITASLSASGTPSNSTFLRGDNTWAAASSIGSASISILDENIQLTSDVASINFTGSGVNVTNVGDAVTVTVPGVVGGISQIIAGTGISASAATGNVTLTNTGVTQLTAGTNVTLSATTGSVVINSTNNVGTVQSIIPGNGLILQSTTGTEISTPTIGIDKTGSNNYIIVGKSDAVPDPVDFIAFNDTATTAIKTTTFATIPMTTLPLVKTYIDTGDADVIKNTTDVYNTTAKIINVVTLTVDEHADLVTAGTTNLNTLYIIIPNASAGTEVTVTLNTTNNITGGTAGVDYIISGDANGAQIKGVEGEPYTFTTILTPAAGKYFSTAASGMVVAGAIPNSSGNANQTLTGVIAAVPAPQVTATLLVVTNIQGGPASAWSVTGNATGATSTGASPFTYNFSTTNISITDSNYTWVVTPTVGNGGIVLAAGTINGSQTVVATITGTLQLT